VGIGDTKTPSPGYALPMGNCGIEQKYLFGCGPRPCVVSLFLTVLLSAF
jgi:hypothetical protein